jgi:hypothetical protein
VILWVFLAIGYALFIVQMLFESTPHKTTGVLDLILIVFLVVFFGPALGYIWLIDGGDDTPGGIVVKFWDKEFRIGKRGNQ